VAPEVAAGALDEPDVPDDEVAARALIAKRLPAMARLEPHVRTRRLAGQLSRRGFDGALVGRLLRELVDADADANLDANPDV
jgi:regulatory protein